MPLQVLPDPVLDSLAVAADVFSRNARLPIHDPDGIYRTSVEGDLMDGSESANYCWPDPESAVEAAISVWETFEGNEAGD